MKVKRTLWVVVALLGITAVLYLPASLFFPRMLGFPYRTMAGETPIYSSTPIPPEIHEVVARADARVRESPIFTPEALRHPIFLTDGGVRWRLLSLGGGGAFGLTRPLAGHIVVNRSSIASDRVWNGASVAGSRTLSGVIAHERTHMLVRAHFGLLADRQFPVWAIEGYCDHVAGGGTLSDAEAARLRSDGSRSPALFYYDSRKRVEQTLRDNGGSVDALFRPATRTSDPD
ncbi:hypothetical protein [uncultured Brevundimonas sp.]|uniref:hypothetical protein n=1 Tax=uncultured Brevundimonas sp. TaxID=213418 RepID=UPI0030ECA3BE|tara:strand:+ start:323 stop:1015 length:693 start_codon:yes stop_codon:yes gene_type:complete